jgi:uncharacterized protein (DUF4415 family)
MKKANNDIDPLARERDLTGKKIVRRREANRVVSPEALEPRNIKVHVSMTLDADVLEYFKEKASKPEALPYQSQINQALRDSIVRERVSTSGKAVTRDDNESLEMLLVEIGNLLPEADETTRSTLTFILRDFRLILEQRRKQNARKLA